MFALLDPDLHSLHWDPDPADQNQCRSLTRNTGKKFIFAGILKVTEEALDPDSYSRGADPYPY